MVAAFAMGYRTYACDAPTSSAAATTRTHTHPAARAVFWKYAGAEKGSYSLGAPALVRVPTIHRLFVSPQCAATAWAPMHPHAGRTGGSVNFREEPRPISP